ncbi:hypothetical protein [Metaclostridioides mangenotii]|uniref:hypothetical protein n=1 Tax=Metaclostridioides mangenotii TaxID=1540 RepID=UPI000484AE9E|nr:hypothetical protein [Clostridioides mangenotii]
MRGVFDLFFPIAIIFFLILSIKAKREYKKLRMGKYIEISACLVAGGVMELISKDYISIDDKKKLTILKEWDNRITYLKQLYKEIESNKNMSIKKIGEK